MKLTRKKAISECKELWKEIEESGQSKEAFLFDFPSGEKWADKGYSMNCPLCAYAGFSLPHCPKCPLVNQYGKSCMELGYEEEERSSPEFFEAIRGLK